MKTVLIGMIMIGSIAQAKTTKQPATYLVAGKTVTAEQALNAALGQQEVLKCQSVELKPSKSGTSFSLRAK